MRTSGCGGGGGGRRRGDGGDVGWGGVDGGLARVRIYDAITPSVCSIVCVRTVSIGTRVHERTRRCIAKCEHETILNVRLRFRVRSEVRLRVEQEPGYA